jgi:hypothetical protein
VSSGLARKSASASSTKPAASTSSTTTERSMRWSVCASVVPWPAAAA